MILNISGKWTWKHTFVWVFSFTCMCVSPDPFLKSAVIYELAQQVNDTHV